MNKRYSNSAVICTKDRLEDIHLILDSLIGLTNSIDELVIVDSSDSQELDSMIRSEYNIIIQNLIYKYIHSTPGLTYQRNVAVDNCSCDIIHFLEDDIVVEEDYFDNMNMLFNKYPKVAGVTGVITNFKKINICFQLFNRFFLLPCALPFEKSKILKSHFANTNNWLKDDCFVNRLRGVSSYRSEVFIEDKFDENLEGYGAMEDIDFSYRVGLKYRLIQSPHIRFAHYCSKLNRMSIISSYSMLRNHQEYLSFKNLGKTTSNFYMIWSKLGLFFLIKILKLSAYLKRK